MVSVQNLTKSFGDFSLNVTLVIPDGRITGLVGKNGAGKSTVIKSILGLITPESGSVKVFGKDASNLSPADKQQIGAALSDSGFSGYLTPSDCGKILDKMYEHTAGMDVEARNEILDILRSYLEKREDSSVMITSHIASDLEGLCDDIYLIHQGKILLHEDTDVILSDYGVLKVDEGTFQRLDKQAVLCYKKRRLWLSLSYQSEKILS